MVGVDGRLGHLLGIKALINTRNDPTAQDLTVAFSLDLHNRCARNDPTAQNLTVAFSLDLHNRCVLQNHLLLGLLWDRWHHFHGVITLEPGCVMDLVGDKCVSHVAIGSFKLILINTRE